MSEKKHELYLIAFALLAAAALILFVAFDTPPLSAGPSEWAYDDPFFEEGSDESTIFPQQESCVAEPSKAEQEEEESQEGQAPALAATAYPTKAYSSAIINLNTAGLDELMTLAGIGQVRAQAIIDYRLENGCFNCVEDLLEVTGIGEKTFEKIADRLVV